MSAEPQATVEEISNPFAVLTPQQLAMEESEFEQLIRKEVAKIAQKHGDGHIQSLLQELITQTKEKECDIAAMKKKTGVQDRQVDEAKEAYRATVLKIRETELTTRSVQQNMKQREELSQKMQAEQQQHCVTTRANVEAKIQEISENCEKQEQRAAELEEENEKMQAVLDEKLKALQDTRDSIETEIATNSSNLREVTGLSQKTTQELDLVQAKLSLVNRELNATTVACSTLEQQLTMYKDQLDHMEETKMKPEDVRTLAEKQREAARLRIESTEKQKKEVMQLRRGLEKETNDLRAKLASLKKEMMQAEKDKRVAERTCRKAQENVRTKGK